MDRFDEFFHPVPEKLTVGQIFQLTGTQEFDGQITHLTQETSVAAQRVFGDLRALEDFDQPDRFDFRNERLEQNDAPRWVSGHTVFFF